jgi:hypothetical protein
LQLFPTEEQLQIHLALQSGLPPAEESLSEAGAWLEAIREANERHQVYDPSALEEISAGRRAVFSETARRIRCGQAPWRRFARVLRNGMKLLLSAKPDDTRKV